MKAATVLRLRSVLAAAVAAYARFRSTTVPFPHAPAADVAARYGARLASLGLP